MVFQRILDKINPQRFLKLSFSFRPSSEFLIFKNQRLTRGQVFANIQALAGGLQSLGIGKGDRVATILPSCPEAVYATFLPEIMGTVHVPLNPLLSERELAHILEDCKARAVITIQHFYGMDFRAMLARLRPELPSLNIVVVVTADQCNEPGFFSLHEMMSWIKPLSPPSLDSEDVALISYTSGTTDVPKGVVHTFQCLFSLIRPDLNLTLMRCLLLPFPPFQIAGMLGIVAALTSGGRIILMDHFDPVRMLAAIQEEKVTQVAGSPTMYRLMLMAAKRNHFNLSSLRRVTFGSEPCPPELARSIHECFHCNLENIYATTESLIISWTGLQDDWETAASTVGKPLPGVRVRIVDNERRTLPVGEKGEIAVRSPHTMAGYYNNVSMTAQVLDANGWFYTGDIGTQDEKGYIRLMDRKKDMIIRGGQNIYPAEVEALLLTHLSVRRAAVVGIPHMLTGEAIWAFIELQPGLNLTTRDILAYCRGKIASFKIPEQVRFLGLLPVTATGKIQKFKLRELAQLELSGEKRV